MRTPTVPGVAAHVGDRLRHRGVARVDRLDQGEAAGVLGVHLERVAGVVAVQGERRDQDRAVDPDRVHGRDHLIARDLRRALQDADPGTARVVAFVGVDLRVDRRHASICSRS